MKRKHKRLTFIVLGMGLLAAAGYFRKVVDTGITRFYEYTGAEVELRRLARTR